MYKKNRFAQAVAKVNNTVTNTKDIKNEEGKKMYVVFKIESSSYVSSLSAKIMDRPDDLYSYGDIVMYFHIDRSEKHTIHAITLRRTFEKLWNEKSITGIFGDLTDRDRQGYFKDAYMSIFNKYSDIEKQKLLIEESPYSTSVTYVLDENMNIINYLI